MYTDEIILCLGVADVCMPDGEVLEKNVIQLITQEM